MDFLSFEDNRVGDILESCADGSLGVDEGVRELLDEEDVLQELRANPEVVAFFARHVACVVGCAMARDGGGDATEETIEAGAPSKRDLRGGVAAEVLCGDDAACRAVAAACAASEACWAALGRFLDEGESDDDSPMRANRWERVLVALLRADRRAFAERASRADFLGRLPGRLWTSHAAGMVAAAMIRDACSAKLVSPAEKP